MPDVPDKVFLGSKPCCVNGVGKSDPVDVSVTLDHGSVQP